MQSTFRSLWIRTFLVGLATVTVASAQNISYNQTVLYLYEMVNGFLDIVRPASKGTVLQVLDPSFNVSNGFISLVTDLQANAKNIPLSYIGYTLCVAVGILYVIIMGIGACCLPCCRCCGCCGASVDKKPVEKTDTCKMCILGLLLLAFLVILTAGGACTFIAQTQFTSQLVGPTGANSTPPILTNAINIVNSLINYAENLIQGVENDLSDPILSQDLKEFGTNISNVLLTTIQSQLSNILDTTDSYISSLNNSLTVIDSSLSSVIQAVDNLQTLQQQLSDTINFVKSDCKDAPQVNSISMGANFSQFPNLNSTLTSVSDAENQLNKFDLDKIFQLPNLSNAINNQSQAILSTLNSTIRSALNGLPLANLSSQINSFVDLGTPYFSYLTTYVAYVEDGLVVTSCSILSVVLYFLVGLTIGICGNQPEKQRDVTCSRKTGGCCFTCGSTAAFALFWIMIFVIILFLVGGLTYTELCRDVLHLENSQLLQSVDQFLPQLAGGGLDLPPSLNISQILTVVFQQCKMNVGVFALLSQIVSTSSFLASYFTQLLGSSILGSLNLNQTVSPDLLNQLNNSKYSIVGAINFTSFDNQLNQNLTNPSLTDLANSLNATVCPNSIARLNNASNTTIVMMNLQIQMLRSSLNILQNQTQIGGPLDLSITNLINELNTLQPAIQNATSNIVNVLSQSIISLTIQLLNVLNQQFPTLGQCGPLYDGIQGVIALFCQTLLNPLNALWFTFGWCLALFVPIIIFGLWLGGLFGKQKGDGKNLDAIPSDSGAPAVVKSSNHVDQTAPSQTSVPSIQGNINGAKQNFSGAIFSPPRHIYSNDPRLQSPPYRPISLYPPNPDRNPPHY